MGITNLGAVSMSAGGVYNPETVYKKYKVVSANGGSYMYINSTPAAGVPVTDTTHWQQIASQGLKGDPFEYSDFTPDQLNDLAGKGIVSIVRTSGTGAPGTADTYTITFTDETTTTFTVWNGATGPAGTANALSVAFTPAGNIAETNVQAAIQELDTEKASQAHLIEKTGFGVISGLVVSAQTVPDMTVKVSAGVLYMADGTRFAPAAVASIAVTAADVANQRIDIVYVSSAGVVTYLAGTAAASPTRPSVPAGGVLLATITLGAGANSVTGVADSRKTYGAGEWQYPTLLNGWTRSTYWGYVRYIKDALGFVTIHCGAQGGTGNIFTLPPGYRPTQSRVSSVCVVDGVAYNVEVMATSGTVVTSASTCTFSITYYAGW